MFFSKGRWKYSCACGGLPDRSLKMDHDRSPWRDCDAIKDFRHAVKDFSQALKDLEQIEDVAEQIAESASKAGKKEITTELVRIHIKEQASSEAAEPKVKKDS